MPVLPDEVFLTKKNVGRCLLAGVGFLADAYDLFVINIVKNVLKEVYPGQTSHDTSLIASTALWGAVAGQLFFGGCADLIGRRNIFMSTLFLTTVGALGSVFCRQEHWSGFGLYEQLALCRFILGFGVGGEYPLSATVTSESSTAKTKGRMMALVFSMQGIGNLCASLLMYILLYSDVKKDYVWRIGLGFGALPGLLAFYFRYRMKETEAFTDVKEARISHSTNVFTALRVYKKQIMGTAMSWFLLDITFYGNGLFSGTITQLMGLGSGAKDNALNAVYVALMALPGYYLSVGLLDYVGRRRLQWVGFLTISALYFLLGFAFNDLKKYSALFLILYGMTFLFSNFGPNATTYIIPGEFYPAEVRSTCHGISAASGKIGAAITTYAFPHIKDAIGLNHLLAVCGGVGFCGFLWTLLFVPDYKPGADDIRTEKINEYRTLIAESEREPLVRAINTMS